MDHLKVPPDGLFRLKISQPYNNISNERLWWIGILEPYHSQAIGYLRLLKIFMQVYMIFSQIPNTIDN